MKKEAINWNGNASRKEISSDIRVYGNNRSDGVRNNGGSNEISEATDNGVELKFPPAAPLQAKETNPSLTICK